MEWLSKAMATHIYIPLSQIRPKNHKSFFIITFNYCTLFLLVR